MVIGVVRKPAMEEDFKLQSSLVWIRDLTKLAGFLRTHVHFLQLNNQVRVGLRRSGRIKRLAFAAQSLRRYEENEPDHQADTGESKSEGATQQKTEDGT